MPQLHLGQNSLDAAMQSDAIAKLEQTWEIGSFVLCTYHCSEPIS